MSSMSNSSNFSLWILQIMISFNLFCVMLFLSHVFNLLNALKYLSAPHELAGDTISNFNWVWIYGKKCITSLDIVLYIDSCCYNVFYII